VPVVAVVVVAAVFPNELVPPKLNELPSVVAAGAAEAPNENGEAVVAGGFGVVPEVVDEGVLNENGLLPPNIFAN